MSLAWADLIALFRFSVLFVFKPRMAIQKNRSPVQENSAGSPPKTVPVFYRSFRRLMKSLLSKPRALKKERRSVESHITEV
jgi:hypothetical protein